MYRRASLTSFGLQVRQRGLTLNIYGVFTHPIGLLQLLLDDGLQAHKVADAKYNQGADTCIMNMLLILMASGCKTKHFLLSVQVLANWMRHLNVIGQEGKRLDISVVVLPEWSWCRDHLLRVSVSEAF